MNALHRNKLDGIFGGWGVQKPREVGHHRDFSCILIINSSSMHAMSWIFTLWNTSGKDTHSVSTEQPSVFTNSWCQSPAVEAGSDVCCYQFRIIPFHFQEVSKKKKSKVLMNFWSLDVDLSYITAQSDCAYFFHVLFLTPFALPMPNLEITELPEPLDGMLKIITIRNNMFLFINSILMESAYFVLQGWEKKNCLPPFLFHLPSVHMFFRWYKVHVSYCFFS